MGYRWTQSFTYTFIKVPQLQQLEVHIMLPHSLFPPSKYLSLFINFYYPSTFNSLFLPHAQVSGHPVAFARVLAPSLPGAVLGLPVFLGHAFVFPPKLVVAPHPLAVLLHLWQVRWPNQLHDVFEPQARLTYLSRWASPGVCATRHPRSVVSWRPVFEWVRDARTCHEFVHSLPLEDFEGEAGQVLSETMLLRMADVDSFIVAEETAEQETLLGWHDAIIQLYLQGREEMLPTQNNMFRLSPWRWAKLE